MFRKALIIFLMCLLLVGTMANGAPVPVLMLMGSLIFIALVQSSPREEREVLRNNRG